MSDADFKRARRDLGNNGFATISSDRHDLEQFAETLGFTANAWQDLFPRTSADARPNTMSQAHGLDPFPWHSDGAVSLNPPRYLILRSAEPNETPTQVLDIRSQQSIGRSFRRTVLRTVSSMGPRYLRASFQVADTRRYRWDPRACEVAVGPPGLALAVENTAPDAEIKWTAGLAAIIDNWRMLHRRPKVAPADVGSRHLERLHVYQGSAEGEASV